ncbi:MarR family winged helix-turn-helix transcriptional regulator [Streptomyces sp. NPDC001222]|uniref:MarR family winged helix-turn-helix transcriptional regulator n=1 Tax=Streptomyces sp. NPDC001222 TaxID=3364548 RepID=UPI0036AB1E9D
MGLDRRPVIDCRASARRMSRPARTATHRRPGCAGAVRAALRENLFDGHPGLRSGDPHDRVRNERRLEFGHFFVGQADVHRRHCALEVAGLARTHDRGRDHRVTQQSRERDVRPGECPARQRSWRPARPPPCRCPRWRLSELGAVVGTRPTTLTSVLDRLERRGHITRGTRPGDRRAVLIELTPSGRLTAAIRQAVTDLERRALGNLPADAIPALRTAPGVPS